MEQALKNTIQETCVPLIVEAGVALSLRWPFHTKGAVKQSLLCF